MQIPRIMKGLLFICKIFIFLIIVVFLLTSSLTAYLKNQQLRKYAQHQIEEIIQIHQTNDRLRQEIMAITNDPVYLEKTIRRTFGMIKEGEVGIRKNKVD